MIGVDEVGRGAWAGPVLVCAVDLLVPIYGLTDSKKLTKIKRQKLANEIIASNPVGYGWVSADELDDIGLSAALSLGAAKALASLPDTSKDIVVDGNVQYYPFLKNSQTIIKADLTVPAVSAASIVAKVARDERMYKYGERYPQYGFENHVGYGTAIHKKAITQYSLLPIHRRSFKIPLA